MPARILIADDEPQFLDLMKSHLETRNFEVVSANDGEDAIVKASYWHPQLIILDALMPVLNGYDVCARLKADEILSKTPIIIFTSLSKYKDRKNAQMCGADAYLSKVNDTGFLLDEVDRLLK